jgi:hypothetical protein
MELPDRNMVKDEVVFVHAIRVCGEQTIIST